MGYLYVFLAGRRRNLGHLPIKLPPVDPIECRVYTFYKTAN